MTVLFCHDHRFVAGTDGKIFSKGQFSLQIVARYENVFGELHIAAREQPLGFESPDRFNLVFPDRARFVSLPNLSTPRALLLGDAKARARLEAAIDAADAVIVRLPSEIGLVAATIARRRSKPMIVEVVGCARDGLASHGSPVARLYAPIAAARMRRAVAASPWTLYVTRHFLQSRYPADGEQICASNVQLAAREPGVLARRLAAIRGSDEALTFGMTAAMFHNEKRVDVAIRALALVGKEAPNLRLEVVGAGDTRNLAALAAELGVGDRVRFLGVLPHGERLFSWLDEIDVYVQTSFQEGLPRALIEAMSRAAPALASDAGGTGELVDAEWQHHRGDVERLGGQMLRLRDKVLRERLAGENYTRAAEYAPDILGARRREFWAKFCIRHRLPMNLSTVGT